MRQKSNFLAVIPVIPSSNIQRDIEWYREKTGFEFAFGDEMYAGIKRDHISIHLQWHAGTKEDPLLGGSSIKIFVKEIIPIFKEFVERGTIKNEAIQLSTSWNTNEFGFYDLNNNAVFFVEEL